MRFSVLICVATLSLAFLTGCGSSRTAPVTGTVTLDGQPVAGAGIAFRPKGGGRMSTAETDEQGGFTLTCYDRSDGAIPGVHEVTVTKFEDDKVRLPAGVDAEDAEFLSAGAPPPKREWIVPEKYSEPSTSGLTFSVEKGKNVAKFEL